MRFLSPIFLPAFLLIALVFPGTAGALDVPRPVGYVTDRANLLAPSTTLRLDQVLADFERTDSTQIVVLTIPSLEGEVLEEYSLRVAEEWGIGQQGKDNGALLLISKSDRKIRIEVGYGLEGRLTDLLAGRIIDNEITPRFKQGDFDGGVVAGVSSMMEAVRGEYQGTGRTGTRHKRSPWGTLLLLLFLGPGMMFLRSPRSRSRHGGFWIGGPFGGGGFGGGGFSGGGGGFGGGGSSGGW